MPRHEVVAHLAVELDGARPEEAVVRARVEESFATGEAARRTP